MARRRRGKQCADSASNNKIWVGLSNGQSGWRYLANFSVMIRLLKDL
jgi:hypothetical protein